MKYIKNRKHINEAIKDFLNNKQIQRVRSVWGSSLLELDRAEVTENIELGKWTLSKEDKKKVLNSFFNTNIDFIENSFNSIDKHFWKSLSESMKVELFNKSQSILDNKLDWSKPTFHQICVLYYNIFYKINIGETKDTQYILRGEDGKPILGENNKVQKIDKTDDEKNKLYFSTSTYNINSFASDYDDLYNTKYYDIFRHPNLLNIYSLQSNGVKGEFDLFGDDDLLLNITDHPSDVLNMSVSKYFTSCQELYAGGGHGTQYMKGLIYNLFDPNTVPAFLYFDTPYIESGMSGDEVISDKVILSRLLIRNVTKIESNGDIESVGLYFDRGYPDRMRDILIYIIEKYTKNVNDSSLSGSYNYNSLLDLSADEYYDISLPYHDNFSPVKRGLIGVNTKILKLDKDYSDFILSNNNKIEKIIINNTNIPSNLFTCKLNNLKNIVFNYMKITDIKIFNDILNDKIEFHKCYLYNGLFNDMDNIDELSIIGCYSVDFNNIDKLSIKKLTIKYLPKDVSNLDRILDISTLKEIIVSFDVKRNTDFINKLKSKNIKITISGLDI